MEVDGAPLAVPSGIEGVVILNINSYGGGATLWPVVTAGSAEDPDDGGSPLFAAAQRHLRRRRADDAAGSTRSENEVRVRLLLMASAA